MNPLPQTLVAFRALHLLVALSVFATCALHAAATTVDPIRPFDTRQPHVPELRDALRSSIEQQAQLRPEPPSGDGALFDRFASAVAISSDIAIVGAPNDDIGGAADRGSAYVFVFVDGGWRFEAKIIAPDGTEGDVFGSSVALEGNLAVIGAPGDDLGSAESQGSAHVFERTEAGWEHRAKLIASDGAAYDNLGKSVAVAAATILIGAPSHDGPGDFGRGSVYAFEPSGGGWSQQAKLLADAGPSFQRFGVSLAFGGNTAVVGVESDSAYVFVRQGDGTWTLQTRLAAPATNSLFGNAVAISGDVILIGAPGEAIGPGASQGAAHVYVRENGLWTRRQRLNADDPASFVYFAGAVAIEGGTAVIGATRGSAAYVFKLQEGVWAQEERLTAGQQPAPDEFGYTVAIGGGRVFIGAPSGAVGANTYGQGFLHVIVSSGGNWMEQARLDAGNGHSHKRFARSVALFGDTAVIGVPNFRQGRGCVYVFRRAGRAWIREALLTPPDAESYDYFGTSVAISGDTLMVRTSAAVYVFAFRDGQWLPTQRLDASSGNPFGDQGAGIALFQDTALVGAEGIGVAYVFERLDQQWVLRQQLAPQDAGPGSGFGYSVALRENKAIIGAPLGGSGSAYIFEHIGDSWIQRTKLVPSIASFELSYGASVGISGRTAVVGTPGDDIGGRTNQGSASIYLDTGDSWAFLRKLSDAGGGEYDNFGAAVELDGSTLLVGSPGFGPVGDEGSVFLYSRAGVDWLLRANLVSQTGGTGQAMGRSLGLFHDSALAGAPEFNGPAPFGNPYEGAAYLFIGLETVSPMFANGFE